VPEKGNKCKNEGDSMEMKKILRIAPLVLAFTMLIPIGAMATTYSYSGQDFSVLSGSSVNWENNGQAYIDQNLGTIPIGSTFSWYNECHNANGGDPVHPVLTAWTNGVGQSYNLPNLGPYSYTSNFLYTTTSVTAGSGYRQLQVTHQYYSGASKTNYAQTYTGAP
jgi:hypothetical protein